MQVVIHAGAHITDEDRLVKCLTGNRKPLAGIGTNIPGPASYRKLFRDIFQAAKESPLSDETREVLLDVLIKGEASDRMVLSNPGFFGTPKMALSGGKLYKAAEQRLALFQQIFHHDEIELFIAICNPATFIPSLFQRTPIDNFTSYIARNEPRLVRWSDMLSRIRNDFPQIPITVWCNEDLPLVWSQVIREMAGMDPTMSFDGEYSFLSEIMSETGMKRFDSYMETHPGMSEIQKRRVIAAFLDKFAREDQIEEELDVSGWSDELIAELTEIYDEDLFAIQRIPGINLIMP